MLKILWYIFLVFITTSGVVWLIENNGTIVVNWLGYELQTDILVAILTLGFFALTIIFTSYILTKILAIKFPKLLKLLFRKSYTEKLEKIILKHQLGLEELSKLLLALEVEDFTKGKEIYQTLKNNIKNKAFNDFFEAKFALENQDFKTAENLFAQFKDNPHSKILFLKAKLKIAIQSKEDDKAINIAKEILALKKDSYKTAQDLLNLYKKNGHWQSAKALINEIGADKFGEELQQRDKVILNASLAQEALKNKKYLQAIRYSKIALNINDQFFPATEILIKSWIKLGLRFKAISIIKKTWKDNPNLILAEIYSSLYRKSSTQKRVDAIKKLVISNPDSTHSNSAIGIVAFRAGAYKIAREFLNLAILKEKSRHLYLLLAYTEKHLGNHEEFYKNLTIAKMLPKESYYTCSSCDHGSTKWQATCDNCGSFDSLQWNN